MSETTHDADAAPPPEPPEARPPVAARAGRRSRRRFWWWFPLILPFQVALVLLLAILWILGTQSGLRFALSLADDLAPGLVQVERVEGRLLGTLHLEGLRVRPPGVELDFSNLALRWHPLAALSGTLRVTELSARALDIAIVPSGNAEDEEEASGPVELPEIPLPPGLELELEQARVGQLSVGALHEDSRFRIDRITLTGGWVDTQVTVRKLALTLPEPQLTAAAQGKMELTGKYPLTLGLTWNLSQAPALKLAGAATIEGDLETLRVDQDLTGAARAGLQALVQGVLERPRWEGELRIREVDLPALHPDLPALDLHGSLTTRGDLDAAWLRGNLVGAAPDLLGPERLQARLDLDWQGERLEIAALELTGDRSGALLAATGKLDLSHPVGKVDLDAAWKQLRWPLAGDPIAEARQGALQVRGTLDAFAYRLSSELRGPTLPAARLKLEGEGNRESTRIEALRLETLGGSLQAQADVAWTPAVTWDAELRIADIDPGRQWPEWAGNLDGRILTKGGLEDGGPKFDAQLESLAGKLRGYPVAAQGGLGMQGTKLQIDKLRVASGPSRLEIDGSVDRSVDDSNDGPTDGSIGEPLDLTLRLESPDLGTLLPDAQGRLQANGALAGTLAAPKVELALTAGGIALAEQSLQSLQGAVRVHLVPDGPIAIDLTGQDLAVGGMQFDSLRLQGNGQTNGHRLSVEATGAPLALDLRVTGSLKENYAYTGRLETLNLDSHAFGRWRLQQTAPVELAGARINAGPLCIREEKGGSGGCVRFEQPEAGNWQAALDLDRLDFELFEDFIPQDLILTGEAKARADFRAAGGALVGKADVQVPEGLLNILSGGDKAYSGQLRFTAANLAVTADGKDLRARLAVPLADLGRLSAEATLPGWSLNDPARPDQPLRGNIQARIENLSLLSRLVPDITKPTGNLKADFRLGGTLAQPGLRGAARLVGGGLQVPLIGLTIEDLNFTAEAKGLDRIEYRGGLKAGAGNLNIDGRTLMDATGMNTRITAKGDRLTLADSKEYFIRAAPDIQVEIGPAGAKITGKLRVPRARIRPRRIPAGTVSPSPDIAIAAKGRKQKTSPYGTSIDLRLALGNKVTLDAFGLEGTLRGALALRQAPGKELLGDGKLEIVEGTYRLSFGGGLSAVLGEPLTIEQGFLSYAKSPITNPFLILTAQREGGDITAGLRVFGTLKNPKLTFFSATDPGMSQADITKYLLTGIPPKGNEQDQAISLGTYIAPKLFVEYDYSLGDESDKIKLRYDLSNRIELQTETGEAQGGDIFFTFER
ncbi:MAG: translocation/assembly module TamB domain-containing protein [Candidatus Thiosymbion ectosymbiont of Robbea hypermnestra]|nr:translocation/assembly module TamB domain-containing protein [Candidatus Thiosymbion ectosymbiont of Robbea hypermnestra]